MLYFTITILTSATYHTSGTDHGLSQGGMGLVVSPPDEV